MKTYNHLYRSKQLFDLFLSQHTISKEHNHFIQVFIGNNNPDRFQKTLTDIASSLPQSSLIATSTAGEILNGAMEDNSVVVSITTFKATDVKTYLIEGSSEEEIAKKVLSKISAQKTKLLLIFNNLFNNDGELILEVLQDEMPQLKIAGGNAGDNGEFSLSTMVGTHQGSSNSAIAVAIFDSEILQVYNNYLFNWQTIGEEMLITKADKNTLYEINNKKAVEIYKEFLGEEVAKHLPASGVEFPLIFNEDGLDIARAPVAIGESGEIIMAGHMKENSTVKFGFGDVEQNDISVYDTLQSFAKKPIESIFIYSCSARKYFLKEHLNSEFEMLQKIAPTAGFVTYGEFFKFNCSNKMLNVSSTFIGLSEDETLQHKITFQEKQTDSTTRTLHALTHLVKVTSQNIDKKNHRLNQFKTLIQESSIYSSTDKNGIITDVNKGFEELSGYTRDELIGKKHSIVRNKEMSQDVYDEMWDTITKKQVWKGIVKNKAKDGRAYYVRSKIFPIVDIQGEIVEYISIREDITEEIQRKEHLEGSLHNLTQRTKEREYLLHQYENIINLSSAFFRVDKEFNILHANDVFCSIYETTAHKMDGKNLSQMIEKNFFKTQYDSISKTLTQKGKWKGVIPFAKEDGTIIYMDTSANTIYDKKNNLIEVMVVLHDISDLITAKKEIEETQKDVVFTMGAIGETRSKETGQHVKRVAEYSKVLALAYGLSEQESELLKMASPMHDIGKVGIPDAILNKPAKLTPQEWSVMKSHASLGYAMLKNSKREILRAAALIAHTHHEQWDGNGYPKGLKGEDIPIFGRITAIADVFDALGSERCYKKAWRDEDIFKLLKESSGKHFDPTLISLFFKNLQKFKDIRDQFKD